jgi:hypothetical protein
LRGVQFPHCNVVCSFNFNFNFLTNQAEFELAKAKEEAEQLRQVANQLHGARHDQQITDLNARQAEEARNLMLTMSPEPLLPQQSVAPLTPSPKQKPSPPPLLFTSGGLLVFEIICVLFLRGVCVCM